MHMRYIIIVFLVFIYFSLFIIEQIRPLRTPVRPLLSRMAVNFSFTLLVYITASILIAPSAKYMVDLTQIYRFGLLPLLPLNSFLIFVSGFLLMDLSFYYWHRLNHKIPLLWRFHNVHHVDQDLDVTTSMRFHFVEIAYSSLFRLIQLGLIGANPIIFFSYEFVFQAGTFFHHSNIRLPIRFERMINKIIVTPRMHGIHHSNFQDETNRNYGVIFSFWDRLHRTIRLNVPQRAITIGVPAYAKPSDNTLSRLLLLPFKRQRHYWQINHKKQFSRPEKHLNENLNQLSE
ncbi:sterol desaturase family protein [Legionella israelensis]|uniref:Sterol desaturase n=2 Tax=Legionella israelensis TaxID=454 RepID=A0A0W0WSC2_9GAMM|nr:sterol desaturase family protein [Legionella israelensis]KTD35199.1 sterol desaturase [Legionella israelensis]QBS10724.1 sterol desaturase family protein [Legionella israelensis]SCY54310.1 Sterol desaturase/sphingolipid hydroxylase, fatty acid hydroxylase superfamily [Legionella israelensis DSM 19235]STX57690.1 sterol desaturase [Legionella israelensis]